MRVQSRIRSALQANLYSNTSKSPNPTKRSERRMALRQALDACGGAMIAVHHTRRAERAGELNAPPESRVK
jgi:hypothetical protein